MKRILLIFLITLTVMFSACSGKKAQEIYETAQFEELQKNTVHAKQLYQEIMEKYPGTEYAVKASERLKALEKKD
jgi:TolA-binding protein